jgi:hypothetical protein
MIIASEQQISYACPYLSTDNTIINLLRAERERNLHFEIADCPVTSHQFKKVKFKLVFCFHSLPVNIEMRKFRRRKAAAKGGLKVSEAKKLLLVSVGVSERLI